MPMKFIALPDVDTPAMRAHGLGDIYSRVARAAPGRGYKPITGFASLAALFQNIKSELEANNFDCMAELEIYAHGSPQSCDGLTLGDPAAFGTQMRSVSLCDNVHVYLTGCNTGVRSSFNESLAQAVSRHTPTEAADMVRVYVHGSVGYTLRTNMAGNQATTRSTWARNRLGVSHYYVSYPDVHVNGVRHPGSTAASGAACYRAFREGNPA